MTFEIVYIEIILPEWFCQAKGNFSKFLKKYQKYQVFIKASVLPWYRNQSTDFHSKSIDWFLYEGNTGI